MNAERIWHPVTFQDRYSRIFRVSFRVAEEATWDHRVHDLDGREIALEELRLTQSDQRQLQTSCDSAVGARILRVASPRVMERSHEPRLAAAVQ
jgi:hypothetical protein